MAFGFTVFVDSVKGMDGRDVKLIALVFDWLSPFAVRGA